ncbi:MAG: hypothetical protein M3R02_28715 [Chloroflexota bacterium]|nr:hypothetical protein [Chloroflexota bacterium]
MGRSRKGLKTAAAEIGMAVEVTTLAVADPLRGVRLAVPTEIRVREGRLEWRIDPDWQEGAPADQCLWAFLRLADDKGDAGVVAFARRYGVLGIGADGKPGTAGGGFPPTIDGGESAWFSEPLQSWRAHARNAKAVLTLAMELRRGHLIDPRRVLKEAGFDRVTFDYPVEPPYFEGDPPTATPYLRTLQLLEPKVFVNNMDPHAGQKGRMPKSLDDQRGWLASYIGLVWLRNAAISPHVVWEGQAARMTLGLSEGRSLGYLSAWPPNTLFSVLTAQLAGVVCSGERLGRCDGCGQIYKGEQRPRADQPHYCGTMCRDEAVKRTKRESAARRRAQQKTAPSAGTDSKTDSRVDGRTREATDGET